MELWKTWGRSGHSFGILWLSCEHSGETLWQESLSHPLQGQALSGCHFLSSSGLGLCRNMVLTQGGLYHIEEFCLPVCFSKRITVGTLKPGTRGWAHQNSSCSALPQLLCAQHHYNSETSDFIPSVSGFPTCKIVVIKKSIALALQLANANKDQ